jgi:hypothetical protein
LGHRGGDLVGGAVMEQPADEDAVLPARQQHRDHSVGRSGDQPPLGQLEGGAPQPPVGAVDDLQRQVEPVETVPRGPQRRRMVGVDHVVHCPHRRRAQVARIRQRPEGGEVHPVDEQEDLVAGHGRSRLALRQRAQ